MKKLILIFSVSLLAACGGKNGGKLSEMKVELETLKKQKDDISSKIEKLQEQIAKLDTAAASQEKVKLVTIQELQLQNFSHYIDLQGRIATDNVFYVTPRGMGGQVKSIFVKQGDRVKKGQLLLELDDAVIKQQISSMKTQLAYASDLYNRQKNLWSEGIGTEVQVLTSKNNVESLEKQMSLLNEQLTMTKVYAQVSGVAETVNIRVGEVFTGNPMAGITIVDPSNLKAVVDVPENYISQVRKGVPAIVEVSDINKKINTSISLVSELIGANTRSFTAECKVAADPLLKPNQVAIIRILDHQSKDAVVVPVATVQTDDKGKYVYVMASENGKTVAKKKLVTVGEIYDDLIEVKSGLSAGDQLITHGYQGLYEGQLIATK